VQENNPEARTWGILCHVASIGGFVVPFGNILEPLIIWLIKKEEDPYIDAQGKESLNFQISITIYGTILFLLFIIAALLPNFAALLPNFSVLLVWLALLGFVVTVVILVILGSVQASKGNIYRYPFTIRFLR
jgi:uncharacterized Tic20 family protein